MPCFCVAIKGECCSAMFCMSKPRELRGLSESFSVCMNMLCWIWAFSIAALLFGRVPENRLAVLTLRHRRFFFVEEVQSLLLVGDFLLEFSSRSTRALDRLSCSLASSGCWKKMLLASPDSLFLGLLGDGLLLRVMTIWRRAEVCSRSG